MSRAFMLGVTIATTIACTSPGAETRRDGDGDGISDEHEAILGTDPNHPEPLRVVLEDGAESDERRKRPGYDATKDFAQIEFCHVAGDRYLWRATLAAQPRLEDTVFHLYVDADADSATGRKGSENAASTGTEYMLTVAGGRGTSSHYDAEGNRISGPLVTYVVQDKTLFISADVELGRDEHGVRYALYVLCHSITDPGSKRPSMSDSTGKRLISGVKVSDRKKVLRPRDHTQNFRVAATFGPQRLRDVLVEQGNIGVRHDALERDGFEVDQFTYRRWPHVKLSTGRGRVCTAVPKLLLLRSHFLHAGGAM